MTAPEKIKGPVAMSVMLHAGLFAFVLIAPGFLNFSPAENWGTANAGDNAVNVKIVGSSSGIALPAPEVVKEDAAPNDSKGLHKEEPAPPPVPTKEKAEPILSPKAPPKKNAAPTPITAPRNVKPAEPEPNNAVPYGKGGNPAVTYGQFSTQPGVGSGFGDGAFGAKYSDYVNTMNRKISQNWLKGLVNGSVVRAPKVFLSFDIERDGSIKNIEITQSSNIPSLDNSAKRALYASDKLPPLPADYTGTRVHVTYYFEYIK